MPINHATIPSGIGPRWPSDQPPRSSGWLRTASTYRVIESTSCWSSAASLNRGITNGPIRIASAIWVGVAESRDGTDAPGTTPPVAPIWWQPAQDEANTSRPCDSDPCPGSAVGMGGPPSDWI